MAPCLITLDDPHTQIHKFLILDAMLAQYILCYGPVFVSLSAWLGAEGPCDT